MKPSLLIKLTWKGAIPVTCRAWGCVAWFAFSALAYGAPVLSVDELFLSGLRERRMFQLAETYCRQRLASQPLSDLERGLLTTEWIRTLTERAVQTQPDERAPLWKRTEEVATEFVARQPDHPRVLVVRTQFALSVLGRGELARLESEVAPNPAAAIDEARSTIRQAARLLEDLDRELTAAIPARRRAAPAADGLTADELASLQHYVLYELARAFRNQALSYGEGTSDRVAALTQSLEQLERLSSRVAEGEELAWRVNLDRAMCHRLLSDFDAAQARLAELVRDGIPASIRLAARAELVRLRLAAKGPPAAMEILQEGRELAGATSPELDFAHLEVYVAMWQAAADAGQSADVAQWRDKSVAAVQFVEQTHGPYWGRRADILLVRTGSERSGGSVEILRRAADDLYLKGRLEEAAAAFDRAASAAVEGTNQPAAFELRYKAALVQQQRTLYDEAARRFRDLSLDMRTHPQSSSAHLLAVVNVAHLCRTDSSRLQQYTAWLEEHISFWPYAATSNRAQMWLGGVRENDRNWTNAIAAYQSVQPSDEQYGDALAGAERCWIAALSARVAEGEKVDETAEQAARFFHDVTRGPDKGVPAQWTDAQRHAVLAAARLRLLFTAGARKETELLLREAMAGMPPPSAAWSAAARVLLVVALAGQSGRAAEAKQLVAQVDGSSPEHLLELLRSLSTLQASASGVAKRELAQLQLAACDAIWPTRQGLQEAPRIELARRRALALLETGNVSAAIDASGELAGQFPQRLEIQAEYAEILLASDDRNLLQRGLDRWRILASQSPPRSDAWFQAKLGVARAQLKMGDKLEAAKRIRYLQATENLARDGWEERFAQVLRQCEE